MITQLLQLCKKRLQLNQLPQIQFLSQETVGTGSSFGIFDGTIKVATLNRHQMDIFRTLVHELVHWKQMQDGEKLDGNDGSKTENDANAIAGVIMREFGKLHPEYFIESLNRR